MLNKKMLLLIMLFSLNLSAVELMKDYFDYKDERPLPDIPSNLVYDEGTTEVTSQVNEYENITANKPITVTIFVTHDVKNTVDQSSFRIGSKKLNPSFVKTTEMSSNNIVVSIYQFELDGMPSGIHTLPAISVSVGGKSVQALPLVINIPNPN